ncbi:hypothetical protein ACGFY9_16670 [Streptomyces sp. NPDC048504]|uniref:hypothetical protein n=1 Tax=Streptomyces sp. NPDC048504 TaxID=3365559 RepID=UPI003721835F
MLTDMPTPRPKQSTVPTPGEADLSYDLVVGRDAAKRGLHLLPERERERAILHLRFFEAFTYAPVRRRTA